VSGINQNFPNGILIFIKFPVPSLPIVIAKGFSFGVETLVFSPDKRFTTGTKTFSFKYTLNGLKNEK
jgi:hypothetical protein|tara:strand:- start:415 stop:615 length:201 start_codon:yes stop_codon:yes gene_type:complete